MRLAVLVLSAVLLCPAASLAADPRAAKEDPAVALSRFVLTEETWNKMQSTAAAQVQQYVEGMLRQSGTVVPAGFGERFSAAYMKMFTYAEMIDLQAGLLAKYYTQAEVKELLAFYKTPLGQKAIHAMPEITQDVNGQMLIVLQQRLPALMEQLKAEPAPGKPAAR